MKIAEPESPEDFEQYYDLRWRILRAPWNQPRGSEKDEHEKSAYHLAVWSDNDELIGVGRLHSVDSESAQIRFIAVAEEFRGKGVGRFILDGLEKEAAKRGVRRIILNARSETADFYLKAGYSITGEGPLLFGKIPHLAMGKKI